MSVIAALALVRMVDPPPARQGWGRFFHEVLQLRWPHSTFCGNGGRCIVAFAHALGVHSGTCRFLGTDGWHHGEVLADGQVRISMTDVDQVTRIGRQRAYPQYRVAPIMFLSNPKWKIWMFLLKAGRSGIVRRSMPYLLSGVEVCSLPYAFRR
jgi:hypothetical protein